MRGLRQLRYFRNGLLIGLMVAFHGAACASDEAVVRKTLAVLEDATNRHDIAAILAVAAPDVVMVSKNGQILRGKAELAHYLEKMLGAMPALKDLRTRVVLDEPVNRAGDVLMAHGTSIDEYAFTDGLHLAITTSWSATLAPQPDGWKVASIHFSFNLFDNPLLNGMRRAAWMAGVGGFAAGLLLVWVYARIRRRCSVS